jgi:hypothetical protein
MKTCRRPVTVRAFAALVLGVVLAGRAGAAPDAPITLRDGRLTAEIVAQPLPEVVERIAALAGAEVSGLDTLTDEPVSVAFADLPLADAIARLLPARSFLLVVSRAGGAPRLARVVILPSAPRLPVSAAPPVRLPEPDPADVLRETIGAQEEPAARIGALGELAALAASDPDAARVLADVSDRDQDEDVREAARAALDQVQRAR